MQAALRETGCHDYSLFLRDDVLWLEISKPKTLNEHEQAWQSAWRPRATVCGSRSKKSGSATPQIGSLRTSFQRQGGSPMISVNSKKRELIGNFRNAGVKWDRSPVLVNDHDECGRFVDLAMPVKMDPMSLVPPPPKRRLRRRTT